MSTLNHSLLKKLNGEIQALRLLISFNLNKISAINELISLEENRKADPKRLLNYYRERKLLFDKNTDALKIQSQLITEYKQLAKRLQSVQPEVETPAPANPGPANQEEAAMAFAFPTADSLNPDPEEYLTKAVEERKPISAEHPFYKNKGWLKKLLARWEALEEYELCAQVHRRICMVA